ncbi:hypothetical protein AArcCO_4032 (plasmid) [Halalkaliarchaeum sp. AArc-CO]|nr:hypothetical protein AArcCO_4032 [Halalkaliarchaeum sp. AArc-CO]
MKFRNDFLVSETEPLEQQFEVTYETFEQGLPGFPQFCEPVTDLNYLVETPDKVCVQSLTVIGRLINSDRLRTFDGSHQFDLKQAADQYGPAIDA